MPDTSIIPLEGCKVDATDRATSLGATAKCRLFRVGFVPTPTSTRADYIANEADFDGYPAGGVTVAAWHAPELNGGAGYMIYGTAVISFVWAHVSLDVVNTIQGYWVEDATPKVRGSTTFQTAVVLGGPDQVLPIIPTLTSSIFG